MQRNCSYFVANKLYLAVTNRCNSNNIVYLRGPSFKMTQFEPLMDGFEPSAVELFEQVENAFLHDKIQVSSMESDEVTFAGLGEPLMRYETVCEAAALIKSKRHGVPLRVKTNGLINSNQLNSILQSLKEAGIDELSVHLPCDKPDQFNKIMKPEDGRSFVDVISFISGAVEAEFKVTCTTVDMPGVHVPSVRALANALGVEQFRTMKYFP